MRTLLTLLVLLAPLSSIAAPLFVPLGISETESARLTPDGTAVIGVRSVGGEKQFFRWTREGGFADLGELGPNAGVSDVSSDGAVVVGVRQPTQSEPFQSFVWTAATGPVAAPSGVGLVSADGSVLVGNSAGPFRWTAADGVVPLEGGAYATDVSADGRTIVGATEMICCDPHAVYWDIQLDMTVLPMPPNHAYSHPTAVSADGTTIVGWSGQLESEQPFRWTPSGGTELLAAATWGIANGVSADGSVIVGTGGPYFDPAAFIWDAHGFRVLGDELVARGTDLAGWKLISARSISDDGRVILGLGANPNNGNREMWIAIIPEPSTAFLAALGLVALARKPLPGVSRS